MAHPDALRQVVADGVARALPDLTPRAARLPAISGKADVVVGPRRAGKTWFLFQQMRELLDAGVPRTHLLYVDFDDERLLPMRPDQLQELIDAGWALASGDHDRWFLFDEIQNVDGWARPIRRLVAMDRVHVVVTGSSARLLSREIATSMRGRSISTEITPFSFSEVVRHRGLDRPSSRPPTASESRRLSALFDAYFEVGGYPEVQSVAPDVRIRVLQEYVDVALYRDVVERHDVSNTAALRWLVRRLLSSPSGRFSINRFHRDLRSQGLPVGKDTLHDYLQHLEDAFLVRTTSIFGGSERRRMVNPRKAYPIDHALPAAFAFGVDRDHGHRLENLVFNEVCRSPRRVSYFQNADGQEVDFVVETPQGLPALIQVCADLSHEGTRRRELRGLSDACQSLGLSHGLVVCRRATPTEERVGAVTVRVVPAWQWLLEGRGEPV